MTLYTKYILKRRGRRRDVQPCRCCRKAFSPGDTVVSRSGSSHHARVHYCEECAKKVNIIPQEGDSL